MAAEKRILIVGPSWVGDMVMAHSLVQLLRERHRGALIDVLAPAWSRPLLDRMPGVRAAIDMPIGHGELALGARMRLGESLRGQYDQAIVLPNSLKSALVPFFAGIRTRTGWRGEMRFWLLNDIRLLNKKRHPLMVQRFNALAFAADFTNPVPAPFPVLKVRAEGIPDLMARFGLDTARPVLALCPGAEFGPAKRWPEGHYGAVAAAMVARGWQVWVFGSANDRAVAEALVAGAGEAAQHCHILAGETELAEAIDLLSLAGAVVSNDSGLMHIAAALSRPLVVLYGSTSPGFTPPLAKDVETLSIPVDCGPCFQRECPKGHHRCLVDIAPGQVLDALDRLPRPATLAPG
ncbi:MAG: lipopolysaccharide heptosyltransferase II [Porticoccaceae bacterium]|nr:lipopolysaccharide heptosyltransferase II [Porticoccaceae bacterium]MEA3299940.1 lipopolysaccharide heptosyltransferase II [Pseudomonadota bacterium]